MKDYKSPSSARWPGTKTLALGLLVAVWFSAFANAQTLDDVVRPGRLAKVSIEAKGSLLWIPLQPYDLEYEQFDLASGQSVVVFVPTTRDKTIVILCVQSADGKLLQQRFVINVQHDPDQPDRPDEPDKPDEPDVPNVPDGYLGYTKAVAVWAREVVPDDARRKGWEMAKNYDEISKGMLADDSVDPPRPPKYATIAEALDALRLLNRDVLSTPELRESWAVFSTKLRDKAQSHGALPKAEQAQALVAIADGLRHGAK